MKLNYTSSHSVTASANFKTVAPLAAVVLAISALFFTAQKIEDAQIEAIKSNPEHSITRMDLAKAFPEIYTISPDGKEVYNR